jgi:molecular chaperone GrpE (heat shock protein)
LVEKIQGIRTKIENYVGQRAQTETDRTKAQEQAKADFIATITKVVDELEALVDEKL